MEMTHTTQVKITDDQIKGLLCCAFEGGSNYWYLIDRYEYAPGIVADDFNEGGRLNGTWIDYWHRCQLVPLVEGCAIIIDDLEGDYKGKRLDRAAIEKGFKVMAEKYPKHFADVLAENDDATTGDVFLQCCLFGDVIFG